MSKTYKQKVPLNKRIEESNKILAKYPNYIPVIVDLDDRFGTINKSKFLVPKEVSASHLLIAVRAQMKSIKKEEAMFMFSNEMLVCPTAIMSTLYDDYLKNLQYDKTKSSDEKNDKFYYVTIHGENTFG
jgi:GABA(A) receptor-associated protein